jgi:SSS family solute:Na+ symporter
MLLAIGWSPMCGEFKTVFQGINAVISYIAPPITVVFLAGVFWKRASSKAAILTLVLGSLLGLLVFLFDFTGRLESFRKDHAQFAFLNFMVISFLLAVVCGFFMVVFSHVYPEPLTQEKSAMVWRSFAESLREKGWRGMGNYKFLSATLAIVMVALYVIFTWCVS